MHYWPRTRSYADVIQIRGDYKNENGIKIGSRLPNKWSVSDYGPRVLLMFSQTGQIRQMETPHSQKKGGMMLNNWMNVLVCLFFLIIIHSHGGLWNRNPHLYQAKDEDWILPAHPLSHKTPLSDCQNRWAASPKKKKGANVTFTNLHRKRSRSDLFVTTLFKDWISLNS